ncbi:MAG: triose-phosphate isomerase [Candidatus Woesearchaeota archaeon]
MKEIKRKKAEKKFLIINFKNYEEGVGFNAEKLAKLIESFSDEFKRLNLEVFVVVNPTDVFRIASKTRKTRIKIFSVAEPLTYGRNTGFVIPEALKQNKCSGLLINHSEHRISFEGIKFLVQASKKLKMLSLVCIPDASKLSEMISLNPDFIALEPPELIEGKVSVSSARPELIKEAVVIFNSKNKNKTKKTILLCGAGVKNNKDVRKALELGTNGVLVASGLLKAKNKKKELLNLINGFA